MKENYNAILTLPHLKGMKNHINIFICLHSKISTVIVQVIAIKLLIILGIVTNESTHS